MILTHKVSRRVLGGLIATVGLPAGLAAATAFTASPAEAQRYDRRYDSRYDNRYNGPRATASGNWKRLGFKEVDGRRDKDAIEVDEGGRFRALMFRVTGSPARIRDVVVHFEGGGKYRARVRDEFSRGQRSQILDLPGDRRRIDRVTFTYTDLGNNRSRDRNADVALFGLR